MNCGLFDPKTERSDSTKWLASLTSTLRQLAARRGSDSFPWGHYTKHLIGQLLHDVILCAIAIGTNDVIGMRPKRIHTCLQPIVMTVCSKTYFLEFLPRIQAVQAAISDHLEDHLLFCNNAIYCKKENQDDEEITLWASPQLCVASYLGLRLIHGEAVHLRFTTKVPQSAFSAAVLEEEPAEGAENCALVVKCEFCHSCLTKAN